MTWACDPSLTSTIINSYSATGPAFAQALQTIFAAQCALVGDHLWPADATQEVLENPNYDFIVVGAGSAGSVVANRLSEVPEWKVLLVEAGGNPTLATEMPQLFYNNLNTSEDWGYKTQPNEGACRGYKSKGCAWPRGKVLGGCSSINGMFYVRGNKLDYDEWAADGNDGWSYNEVLTYFKKSQHLSGIITEENTLFHNKGGYLNVEYNDNNADDFEKLVIQAAAERGIKHNADVNGADQMGIMITSTTIKDGVRQSTARAFLNPIKDRKNLHVMKNAYVTKVIIESDNTASGIIVNKNGHKYTIKANKEVILSAGAVNTPHLMLLSGIGPRKQLQDLGIDVKANLPVGENLQDHLFVPLLFTFPGDKSLTSLPNVTGAFLQYLLERKGPLVGTAPHRVIAFVNTTDPLATSPDIQLHKLLFPPSVQNMLDVFNLHGLSDEFQEKMRNLNENNFLLLSTAVLLSPKSRGQIILKSTNPYDHPLIYSNYFKDNDDLQTIIRGIKVISKFADTETFKAMGIRLNWIDIDACKRFDKGSDEFLECWAREVTFSLYHPTSTAKMGRQDDETAVVDSELKVKTVKRLRVIDASIMPKIVRGNTNAPVIMIGEKGADMIKNYWLNRHTEL